MSIGNHFVEWVRLTLGFPVFKTTCGRLHDSCQHSALFDSEEFNQSDWRPQYVLDLGWHNQIACARLARISQECLMKTS